MELGAEKLESHFEALKRKDCANANHSLGGFQALKEVAWNFFSIDHVDFSADCMSIITARQEALQEAGEVTAT